MTVFGKIKPPSQLKFSGGEIRAKKAYVLWVDTMGSRSAMVRSHAMATNFLSKMHAAAVTADKAVSKLTGNKLTFPMSDGLFAIFETRQLFERFAAEFFFLVASEFLYESDPKHRFMMRGALAFGEVSTGNDLAAKVAGLKKNNPYTDQLLVGRPLAQAYESEKRAAPFGISIHESALAFGGVGEQPFGGVDYPWLWNKKIVKDSEFGRTLLEGIEEHLHWCEEHSESVMYEKEAIARHLARAKDYFTFNG